MQPTPQEAALSEAVRNAETLLALLRGDPLDDRWMEVALTEAREIVEALETVQHARADRALDHPYTREEAERDLARAKQNRFTNPQLIEAESAVGSVYAVSYQDHPRSWQSVGEIVTSHTPLEFRQNQHRTLIIDRDNSR